MSLEQNELSPVLNETVVHADNPLQNGEVVETTFHLAPSTGQPFRWVGRITTPHEIWSSGQEADQLLEPLTVDLPLGMVPPMLGFARKYIGPNATEQQMTYWCHTFAYAVGATALELTDNVGTQWLADARARLLFSQGSKISPAELIAGEHAAVGDGMSKRPVHSLVGIGPAKGAATGSTLAIQVDGQQGNLYVGDPAAYLEDLKASRSKYNPSAQPGLYVQRTPLNLPVNSR